MKKAGIVSGIGPASTIEYYRDIINNYKNIHGEDVNPEIVIDSINMYEFDKALECEDYNRVARILIKSISNLASAGADFAAIACNTAHIVWDQIDGKTSIPIISILDTTSKYLLDNKYKKIVILASGTTYRNGMYSRVLKKIGITTITPDEDDINIVAGIIYPKLENGIVLKEDKNKLIEIAEKYIMNYDADSILLGCTELTLLVNEGDISVDVVDTTKIHIDAIGKEIDNNELMGGD